MCILCVVVCVAAHLGVLLLAYRLVLPRLRTLHRAAVGLIVLVAIIAHLLEITVFAAGYAVVTLPDGGSRFDEWYHSAAAFTSLGDSLPGTRELRLMTAVEALTGLVLITWTASFTFLVMQRSWDHLEPAPTSLTGPGRAAEPNGIGATKH
jgi:hypothetical protein